MNNDVQTVSVPVDFLEELLNIRREHFIVCEMFHIPLSRRSETWVGRGITERIRTYLTSYVIRRSTVEKETAAAFHEELHPNISDPDILGE